MKPCQILMLRYYLPWSETIAGEIHWLRECSLVPKVPAELNNPLIYQPVGNNMVTRVNAQVICICHVFSRFCSHLPYKASYPKCCGYLEKHHCGSCVFAQENEPIGFCFSLTLCFSTCPAVWSWNMENHGCDTKEDPDIYQHLPWKNPSGRMVWDHQQQRTLETDQATTSRRWNPPKNLEMDWTHPLKANDLCLIRNP